MARTISTPRKIPPTDLVPPTPGKSPKQKELKATKKSRSIAEDEITIVKIVPPPTPPSDYDVEIVYEKACVPLQNEINKGSLAEETIGFLDSVRQCRSLTATPSEEDVEGVGLAVNDDNDNSIEDIEDGDSQDIDMDDGTAARTRPAVLKGRPARAQALSQRHSSPATVVGVMPSPSPQPHQSHHRPSGNGKEAESPAESPHDLDDMQHQHAKAKKGNEGQLKLKPGQKEDTDIVAAERNSPIPVRPSGGREDLVGPLAPAKKGTKRKRGPSKRKTRTTGKGRTGIKRARKPFSCYFCQMTTQSKQTLERHLITHTKEKPFKCHQCEKEFTQKGTLNVHVRRHVKEKPFKCPHTGCSSSFVRCADLKKHSTVHSREKPFVCPHPECDKAFSQGSRLKDHSRVHSEERGFACPFPGCGKAFKRRRDLTRHRRVHGHGRSSAI